MSIPPINPGLWVKGFCWNYRKFITSGCTAFLKAYKQIREAMSHGRCRVSNTMEVNISKSKFSGFMVIRWRYSPAKPSTINAWAATCYLEKTSYQAQESQEPTSYYDQATEPNVRLQDTLPHAHSTFAWYLHLHNQKPIHGPSPQHPLRTTTNLAASPIPHPPRPVPSAAKPYLPYPNGPQPLHAYLHTTTHLPPQERRSKR